MTIKHIKYIYPSIYIYLVIMEIKIKQLINTTSHSSRIAILKNNVHGGLGEVSVKQVIESHSDKPPSVSGGG